MKHQTRLSGYHQILRLLSRRRQIKTHQKTPIFVRHALSPGIAVQNGDSLSRSRLAENRRRTRTLQDRMVGKYPRYLNRPAYRRQQAKEKEDYLRVANGSVRGARSRAAYQAIPRGFSPILTCWPES